MRKLFTLLGVVALSFTMMYGDCNSSKDDPTPTPTVYNPTFVATSVSGSSNGVDVIEFYIRCSSDDVELTRIDVKAPDGGSFTYSGNGNIWLKDELMYIPDVFLKLSGSWSFTIAGTIKSGTHNGEGFTSSASISVSGK